MNFNFRKTTRAALLLVDIALLVAAFYFMWFYFYNAALPMPFFRRGNYILYLIYAAILTALIRVMKGHSIGAMRVTEIMLSQAIAILLTNVIAYFQVSLLFYRLASAAGFLILTGVQFVLLTIWAVAANRLYFKIYAPQRMIFLYDRDDKIDIARKLNIIRQRYCITCYLHVGLEATRVEELLRGYESVVIAVDDHALQERLIRLCYRQHKRLYIVPNLTDIITNGAETVHSLDMPLLLSRNGRLTTEERVVKRMLDLLFSALGLLVLSPVMLLTAAAVWLGERKSVFYAQGRLTRDGKTFRLYKFRSMRVDAERDGARLASAADERITPVGSVIRKLRVDEIPQLFNVLKGDMSIVGPRPERPEIAAQYEAELPEFGLRLNVKAGLTGYAQVYGNYDTSARDKLLMDLIYIENYSVLLDLSLIFQTLRVVLLPSKARGVRKDPLGDPSGKTALGNQR